MLQCIALCCSVSYVSKIQQTRASDCMRPHPGGGGGHGPKIFNGTALDYSPEFVLAIYKLQNTFREKRGINTLVPPASLAHNPAHASLPLVVQTEESIPTHLARVRFVVVWMCVDVCVISVREVCVCMSVHTCLHECTYMFA